MSNLYTRVKENLYNYKKENTYAEVNIGTFIEENIADLKYKNKFVLDKIKESKNASSTCILLGVLGTFVGLSMMLISVDTSDIINSLPETISSMQTAFITSIFGIVCSLIISSFIRSKDSEHALVQLMLKIENLLTAEVSHYKSQLMDSKIEDVKNTIKQISESIESIEEFDKISKDLHEFNRGFTGSVDVLKGLLEGSDNSIRIFDQSIRKLDKQFNIMNIKFEDLFDKYDNQDNMNKEILLEIKESSKHIYDSTENQNGIKDYLKNINVGVEMYEEKAKDILEKLINHEDNLLYAQRELIEERVELDKTIKNLSNIITVSSDDIQNKLELVFKYADIYKEAQNIAGINNNGFDNEEIYDVEKNL
ncbi:MAG: MotA/TolQ/ExbB proton channel family protein [Romboutsia sp.]